MKPTIYTAKNVKVFFNGQEIKMGDCTYTISIRKWEYYPLKDAPEGNYNAQARLRNFVAQLLNHEGPFPRPTQPGAW